MSEKSYGPSLDQFKRRMGLKGSGDLYVLINVTMSPWPSAYNFVEELADSFRDHAEQAMEATVRRNVMSPDFHRFIIQGYRGNRICGVYLPMFNMQNHRKQLVISCKLPKEVHQTLIQYKEKDENMFFSFGNQEPDVLFDLISEGSFKGVIQRGIPGVEGYEQIAKDVQISDINILLERSLQAGDQSSEYPVKMPFFIYSAQDQRDGTPIYNMDHVLTRGPNTQLTSEMVKITAENEEDLKLITEDGCWIVLPSVNEREMQPLVPQDENEMQSFNYTKNFPFAPGQTLKYLAFATEEEALKFDPTAPDTSKPIFSGELKLGPCFVNHDMLNTDGGADVDSEESKGPAHPSGNLSGLMADHPVGSSMPELKGRHESQKVSMLKKRFMTIKQQEAMASIPPWVSKLINLGAEH